MRATIFLIFFGIVSNALAVDTLEDRIDRSVDRGLAFLVVRQKEDGSFGNPDTLHGSDPAVTAFCGLAFLAEGNTPNRGKYGKEVTKIADYLLDIVRKDGLIDDHRRPSLVPMYSQGYSIVFLAEIYGMYDRADFKEKLQKAVDLIVKTQNSEGGWRYEPKIEPIADTSVTSCQLVALRSAKNAGFYVPNEVIEKAMNFLKKCQNPDGGFQYLLLSDNPGYGRSAFGRSAASLLALQSGGLYEGEIIDKGFEYLGKFEKPKTPPEHFHYGYYYASLAIWLGGEKAKVRFESWFVSISEELVRTQNQSGSWSSKQGEIPEECATAMCCIILRIPKQRLPDLQR